MDHEVFSLTISLTPPCLAPDALSLWLADKTSYAQVPIHFNPTGITLLTIIIIIILIINLNMR